MEAGEELVITVAGRPSARLVAVAPHAWRQWSEVGELFCGPADPAWAIDRSARGRRTPGSLDRRVRAVLDTSVVLAADVRALPGEPAVSAVTVAEPPAGQAAARHPPILEVGHLV